MISARTAVHLPDTTYGGTPIDWNYADNSKNELQQLRADNAKLRELVDELYPLADNGAMDASELDRAHDLMRELGIEVD